MAEHQGSLVAAAASPLPQLTGQNVSVSCLSLSSLFRLSSLSLSPIRLFSHPFSIFLSLFPFLHTFLLPPHSTLSPADFFSINFSFSSLSFLPFVFLLRYYSSSLSSTSINRSRMRKREREITDKQAERMGFLSPFLLLLSPSFVPSSLSLRTWNGPGISNQGKDACYLPTFCSPFLISILFLPPSLSSSQFGHENNRSQYLPLAFYSSNSFFFLSFFLPHFLYSFFP